VKLGGDYMPVSAVDAAKNVYNKYFVGRDHWNQAKGKSSHNSFDGLFRAAIDCIFVTTLYYKLPSSDPLKTTLRTVATNMMNDLYNMTGSVTQWKNNPADSPSCGFIAMAFATAYGYLSQSSNYRTRAIEAAEAMNKFYTDNASELSGNPLTTDSDCTRSRRTNNIMAIMGAGLADVAIHIFPNYASNPQSYPYRNALTTFGNYARNSKNPDNDLWRYGGGNQSLELNGVKKKCVMDIGYDVWTVAGLAKIAVGTTYTRPPSTPSSVFWNTARTGVNGLQTLYNLNGKFPQLTGGGYTNNVYSEAPAWVLPISWVKEQTLFDIAMDEAGGYDAAAGSDERGGNSGEPNFHRLLWGLAGAMEYNLTVLR